MIDEGFFVVNTIKGQRFTRSGSMHIANNKNLVLNTGKTVIGNNGPINISDKKFNVDINGNIADKFKIVDLSNTNSVKNLTE